MDRQGGKQYGKVKQDQLVTLRAHNEKIVTDGHYEGVDELETKLEGYAHKFMEFDDDASGDIDMMELKRMMEKMGQAKTHLELKKMIAQVDTNNSGTIHYHEFIEMMLGKASSILRIILMYEEMNKEKDKPAGVAPKKSLADLP